MTSKLTRKDLEEVISTYGKAHIAHRMATELLATMDSEPVAWAKVGQGEQPLGFTQKRELAYLWRKKGYKALPLYAAPQSAPVVTDENTLRIQGIEALEQFLSATTAEPEMLGGIKLTLACSRALKAIIKNDGWADFNNGKPEKIKAETIISALHEPT